MSDTTLVTINDVTFMFGPELLTFPSGTPVSDPEIIAAIGAENLAPVQTNG